MKVKIPGYGTLIGSPMTVLSLMQKARIFDDLQGDELITEIRTTIWRVFQVDIQVKGETLAERAENLLREMDKKHIVEIEED